jgi:hypothetical protein
MLLHAQPERTGELPNSSQLQQTGQTEWQKAFHQAIECLLKHTADLNLR